MKIFKKSIELSGRTLSLEIGRFAEQADAAVLARYGDTMVLATVTSSSAESTLDYFPLSVEYVERLYAGGRIKGSRWVKREGRPSDDAILSARVIDRSIRPLFPKDFKHDVQIVVTVLSVDGENDPDLLGLVATSAALTISKVPWNGPIAAVRMGYVKAQNGEAESFLVNPRTQEQEFSEFDLVVSANSEKVIMLEGGLCETNEEVVTKAITHAKVEILNIIGLIQELAGEVQTVKVPVKVEESKKELQDMISKKYASDLEEVYKTKASHENESPELPILIDKIMADQPELYSKKSIEGAINTIFKEKMRSTILKKHLRVDGRKLDEIRELDVTVGILPRTHGSAVFRRGQTQVLTVATLGTPSLEQLIESPTGEESKRYIHHYSMPPYSVGETGRVGFPSRREVGHGALAEKALLSVIPPESEFPYTIRLVSEVMSSNGSTSMASTCGSTLALMDAGVPIKEPVAGISIGLVTDKDKYTLLTDIMGLEDFGGDMDFKVAGTKNGITAIQLDMKIDGITDEIIKDTFERARIARMKILETMLKVISVPRASLSQYAPKVQVVKVPVEKIGEVIGPGGRMIRQIIASTGATVDVNDDGSVMISGTTSDSVEKAVAWVTGLVKEVKPGEVYEGTVRRIMQFGAFVEVLPGKEGLVHVSHMAHGFVSSPESVVHIGDKVTVKVLEIDSQNRINLTMILDESPQEGGEGAQRHDRPHRDRHDGRRPPRRY